jgi:hypothetical protein
MRKFVLIAAMVVMSTTAQAGQSRSLTLASADQPAASTEPAKATEVATPAETPKFVERPSAVGTTTAPVQPKADTATPVRQTAKADKPKHKKYWTEARIIGELHRHGIYW